MLVSRVPNRPDSARRSLVSTQIFRTFNRRLLVRGIKGAFFAFFKSLLLPWISPVQWVRLKIQILRGHAQIRNNYLGRKNMCSVRRLNPRHVAQTANRLTSASTMPSNINKTYFQ